MIIVFFKSLRFIVNYFFKIFHKLLSNFIFKSNGVLYEDYNTTGTPYVMVARGGYCKIGKNFSMHNGINGNPIGCYSRCTFFVDREAVLIIGNNVGISQTAIICNYQITVGDNVKIGGGVKIYDTDFHSLDYKIRNSNDDMKYKAKAPVVINDNAFIGAYSIILKGTTIGYNSIVGAGSVVTRSIPDNEIWAGNPAKFIRNIQ